ncbi:hypothetical protein SOV_33130 [Sporomusa ovata DSM 2662]|uniref:Arginine/ornithine antiporter ArcD n=1 Tax=Sporomusa ovata TaxID=2378 RepID=A0A0U1L2A5_9FIRM|nr:hypothetical protein [Sporomusa ovata]EQB25249.1 hypothetical protein SOV_5c04170 [Sporomusa ovata DSM 2662]CQR73812.1 Arginine/ornithine antiporter ArcD [Sporomusa ovata]
MYVYASFDYSVFLELAITDLEKRGVAREHILAVPLDKRVEERMVLDTIHRADGISLFDGAMVLGAVFMELGVIYGFVLAWGPIIWGLIGLLGGAVLGFLLDYYYGRFFGHRKKETPRNRVKAGECNNTEVIITVYCDNSQYEMVEKVLWDNRAFGVGKLDRMPTTIRNGVVNDGKETT